MKIKHTLIALLLLAALGGAYYFVQKQPVPEQVSAIPREDLFTFKPEDVQELTLNVSGQPTATFRRLPPDSAAAKPAPQGESAPQPEAQWEIVEPAGMAADSYQIQSFVDEFASFKANPLADDPASTQTPVWAEFALDQPVRSIKMKLKDGKTVSLDVGKDNPSGYAKYARRNETGPVLLLDSADNKSLLEKSLFDLRDKRIMPMEINSATRLDLRFNFGGSGPGAEEIARARSLGLPVRPDRLSFIRDSSGNWRLTEPTRRSDVGGATYLATIIAGGQMHSVIEEKAGNLAQYGLERPQLRVEVHAPSGKSELLVGKMVKEGDQEYFYAMTSLRPHVFTILRTVYDQLNQDLEYYRNRYLFDFETSNARSVELTGPAAAKDSSSGPLRFDRRGENWVKLATMPGTKEKPMKDAQVENFLNGVHAIRISTFTSDEANRYAAFGLDKPWLSVKVTFGENNVQETLLFSRMGDKFYAARQGELAVYELSTSEPASMEDRIKELTAQ